MVVRRINSEKSLSTLVVVSALKMEMLLVVGSMSSTTAIFGTVEAPGVDAFPGPLVCTKIKSRADTCDTDNPACCSILKGSCASRSAASRIRSNSASRTFPCATWT